MAVNELAPQFEVIELSAPEADARVAFRHQMVKVNGCSRRSLEQVLSIEPPITEDEVEALASWEVQPGSIVADVATDKNGNTVVCSPSNTPEVAANFTKWLLGQRGGEYAVLHDFVNTFVAKSAVVYRTQGNSTADNHSPLDISYDVIHLGDTVSGGQPGDSEPAVGVYDVPENSLIGRIRGIFESPKSRRAISIEPPLAEEELQTLNGQRGRSECLAAELLGWAVPERYADSSEVFALELLKKIMILRNAQAGSLAVQNGDQLTRSLARVTSRPNEVNDEALNESHTRLSARLVSLNRVVVNEVLEKNATNVRPEV